ncbi:hypothetical protein SEPCBS119000_001264 [Sporothrix epigloea]|uniref:Uncharacterized protein n=1 Tax=Sporothrix epigloea TaxID=1892477 RepID=A0ABP0DCT0_9PEZI
MDVAAQEITDLVQRILPERPHHLCISATSRYPVPPSLWPSTSPLQYTTYVSEADRGILFTRPYFDIQLEEATSSKRNSGWALSSADAALPAGIPAGANSKSEAKKPVTRLSFKDYQQNKIQKKSSATPLDPPSTPAINTNPSRSEPNMASVDRQHLPQKYDLNGDSPSAIGIRKRIADNNDSTIRPHKRIRSDTSINSISPAAGASSKLSRRLDDPLSPLDITSRKDERPRQIANGQSTKIKQPDIHLDRDESHERGGDREKDRDRGRDRGRDGNPERDRDRELDRDRVRDYGRDKERERDLGQDRYRDRDRNRGVDLGNSRKRDRERVREQERIQDRTDGGRRSPALPSTPKANGHNPRERGRSRSPDTGRGPLAALPPLLSPLHFNPERVSATTKQIKSTVKSASKAPGKSDSAKREESPFRIPPLLSPTLPAIIEQELSRIKHTSAKEPEPKTKPGQELVNSPTSGKKPAQVLNDSNLDHAAPKKSLPQESLRSREEVQKETTESSAQPSSKRSLVVVLKYKKRNAKRVLQLLALQQTPLKAPMRQAERSASIEDTPPPAQVTKKRAANTDTSLGDLQPPPNSAPSSSFKHPRTVAEKSSTISRTHVAPATSSKSTPMARVTSNNSQVLTPGDSVGHTPHSHERSLPGQGDHTTLNVSDYRHRYDTYVKLGTKLKHDRDAIVRSKMPNGVTKLDGTTALSNLTQAERKSVAALSLEMVMSYMIAFKSLNQGRHLERRPSDITVWVKLRPHLEELRGNTRFFKPLEAITAQLRAIFFEQMLASFVGHDAETVAADLMTATKQRIDAWAEVAHCAAAVHDSSLKVVVGPWLSIEDTVRLMLPAVRVWSEREKVGWEQELQPPR